MANSHDGNAQVLSYPQHPPKDFSDLAATLIKNGLGGVDAETLERHLEQVGYFSSKRILVSIPWPILLMRPQTCPPIQRGDTVPANLVQIHIRSGTENSRVRRHNHL